QGDLARSHNSRGILRGSTGDATGALESYEAALAIQRKLAEAHPESPAFAGRLGGTLNNLAMLDLDARRFDAARDRLTEAIAWQRKALAANPRNPTYRRFLANHLENLIKAAQGLGRVDEVAEARRELDELRATDPQFAALDARLAAVLGGEAPKDDAER